MYRGVYSPRRVKKVRAQIRIDPELKAEADRREGLTAEIEAALRDRFGIEIDPNMMVPNPFGNDRLAELEDRIEDQERRLARIEELARREAG